jgi:hypothetical protein
MTDQQIQIDADVLSRYVLAQFLRVCISEDRAAASNAGPHTWNQEGYLVVPPDSEVSGRAIGIMTDTRHAEHIARWDPAHVLAECEVKAKLVDLLLSGRWPDGARLQELRLLGALYADRPGYREEWRP